MMKLILLAFVLCGGAYGRVTGRNSLWSNCMTRRGPVTVTNVDVSPNPVIIPGQMLFSISGYSNTTLGSSRLITDITRLGSWFNLPIPCIGNIGSCTYNDMCTLLDDMIRENWLGIAGGIGQDIKTMLEENGMRPGLCPQPPQIINIHRGVINLPVMPRALYWFAEGVYEANVRVVDNSNDEELACLNFRINMAQAPVECDSWFGCYF